MSEGKPSELQGEVILVEPHDRSIVRAEPGDVIAAVEDYRNIQKALDAAMPDCLITIQGRKFRKKNYWRGIATAFNLTVKQVSEQRVEEGDDWGWIATYTATAGNGRSADGDGACFASEKTDRQGKIIATVHNVRSHAHTRAYNRAVSNLVGFGEVSAEEMMQQKPARRSPGPPPQSGAPTITEKQQKRLFAISSATAERLQVPADEVRGWLREQIEALGLESTKDLTKEPYEMLCDRLEKMRLDDLVPKPADDEEEPF